MELYLSSPSIILRCHYIRAIFGFYGFSCCIILKLNNPSLVFCGCNIPQGIKGLFLKASIGIGLRCFYCIFSIFCLYYLSCKSSGFLWTRVFIILYRIPLACRFTFIVRLRFFYFSSQYIISYLFGDIFTCYKGFRSRFIVLSYIICIRYTYSSIWGIGGGFNMVII